MNREQLAHILRAASRIVENGRMVVIGSQAILGTFSDDELPVAATRSLEADIAFENDPDEEKADRVDGALGEGSSFHQTFSIYGQGVSLQTAVLPDGWQDRVVPFDDENAEPAKAVCLDPHDLVVSKLVAGRPKDFEFAEALIRHNLVDPALLLARANLLPVPGGVIKRVQQSIERRAAAAGKYTTKP